VRRARNGEGPTLLEFRIHQIEGNLEGRVEADEGEKIWCPIYLLGEKLRAEGVLTSDLDLKIRDEEKSTVDEAVRFSVRSLDPEPLDAFTDIFAGGI
jgi:pyruvate dehydrogenase E1 component alpha subunit